MARASKMSCNPDDLRRRGSAVRGARGYANHRGACSNRNALPVCVTRHPRQFAANRGCRLVIVESAASCQSRGIFMRLRNCAHPAISCAPPVTTATLEARFAQRRRRRLSRQTAPTPIPSHGRREGAPLAPHAACWAVRMSMAAARATLAGGFWQFWKRVSREASKLLTVRKP